MAILVTDPQLERRMISERHASGADRYDEVWEGTYTMVPMPNDEHQDLVLGLAAALREVVQSTGLGQVRPGVNVSDRRDDWTQNYRVPDVAVFMVSGIAENLGTHWLGGPDFAIEVITPGDRTRDKIPFYQQLGVRELLLVDRAPWHLELYRLDSGVLSAVGRSDLSSGTALAGKVLPLSFRLVAGNPRPRIEIIHVENGRNWLA